MSLNLLSDYSLKNLNTFGIDAKTKKFVEITSIEDLNDLRTANYFNEENRLVLGGGSNMLLLNDYNGIVVLNSIKGIEKIEEDNETFLIKSGAGEIWHEFVLHCISHNYAGLENLSLIPGSVGASPIQNIGAYGVEIKDHFEKLEAFNLKTGQVETFTKDECNFGYRESIFKRDLKGQYIITAVYYRLNKTPNFNTKYGAIENQLKEDGISELSIKAISDAVIKIRQSKLPDPKEIGNSGSFFKNPVVSNKLYESVKSSFPDVVAYPAPNGMKLAAGWLIDQAGWKGYTRGNHGVHKKQALVLVNYGGATGAEIYKLSQDIIDSIKEKFGVELEREVNMIK